MKLSIKNLATLALAGLLATSVAVSAQDAPLDAASAIKERQTIMKSMGGAMRGGNALTGQPAIDLAKTLAADFERLPSLFPAGSTGADSEASPAIWENFADFTAHADKGKAQANIMLAAAEAGDQAAFAAGVQGVGQACGECHRAFRVQK